MKLYKIFDITESHLWAWKSDLKFAKNIITTLCSKQKRSPEEFEIIEVEDDE